jgi:selenide,water dikinase
VQGLPKFDDENLLVGAEHFSDAGVYRLADDLAIVQSVDFFPPVVNDPFVYGQIAAANALSDVYAMGGHPRTALNIVGFPEQSASMDILQEILRGGADRVQAAGAVIVGGHSVRDDEIVYGLCVTGVVDPRTLMTNQAASPGDTLVLTKAVGTGFITTAHRAGRCPDDVLDAACASMTTLNRAAAEAAVAVGARAATDVTGFGVAGHAHEMAEASGVSLHLELGRLPRLPGAEALSRRGNRTRANASNRAFVEPSLRLAPGLDDVHVEFLVDPQTSGGLLVAVPPTQAEVFVQRCHDSGLDAATVVGSVQQRGEHGLVVSP